MDGVWCLEILVFNHCPYQYISVGGAKKWPCHNSPAPIKLTAWRTCRDACRDRLHAVTGKTFPAFPAHAHPQFCVSGKRSITHAIWMRQSLTSNKTQFRWHVKSWWQTDTFLSQYGYFILVMKGHYRSTHLTRHIMRSKVFLLFDFIEVIIKMKHNYNASVEIRRRSSRYSNGITFVILVIKIREYGGYIFTRQFSRVHSRQHLDCTRRYELVFRMA